MRCQFAAMAKEDQCGKEATYRTNCLRWEELRYFWCEEHRVTVDIPINPPRHHPEGPE